MIRITIQLFIKWRGNRPLHIHYHSLPLQILLIVLGATLSSTLVKAVPLQRNDTPPSRRSQNIIVIYADDLGYGDLGCYGSRLIKTPHLDKMAAEGMRLTDFYSVAPICTPSRAAMMTGRYAVRMGANQMHLSLVLSTTDTTGLPQSETTIARALKRRGYATACIGKWHLGRVSPYRAVDHGFDYFFGIPYSNDMKPTQLIRDSEIIEDPVRQENLTERYAREAIRFIEQSKNGPFFLYLPHTFPHRPLFASDQFKGRSAAGLYGDVVEELDWSVGEILGALKRLGLDDDTLVFFSSDNGPWYQGSTGSLRGRKGSTFEGGVRVPAIARWPGKIPPGRIVSEPASTLDVFPTALAVAGETNPAKASDLPLDGKDLLPLLTGQDSKSPQELLLFFDSIYVQAARLGKWKLHVARWNIPRYTAASSEQKNLILAAGAAKRLVVADDTGPELYDLSLDPSESYDHANNHPDVVHGLQLRIAEALTSFPDEVQTANSDLMKSVPQSR